MGLQASKSGRPVVRLMLGAVALVHFESNVPLLVSLMPSLEFVFGAPLSGSTLARLSDVLVCVQVRSWRLPLLELAFGYERLFAWLLAD